MSRLGCPGPLGSCSPLSSLVALCCVCGFLGHLTPVHLCASLESRVPCAVSWASYVPLCWCAVSWATWLLFTGVLARCFVLRVQCPGPLGSCSPVRSLGELCCARSVLGHLALVPQCVGSVLCVVCAVFWAPGLLFTCVPARCVVSRGCVACAVSWATLLLFTGVPARCVVSRVRCPGPIGSCSPLCSPAALRCVCGVLGLLAPVHRCARSVRCVACLRCPWPVGSCSPLCPLRVGCCVRRVLGHLAPVRVCSLGALCCVRRVPGHLAPVHRCARSVLCAACAVSWATWLLFIGVLARGFVLRVRCPGPLWSW